MKIPANSLTRRNPPLMLAAVACDAARRACASAGRPELAAYLRGAKVTPGKAVFLTGRAMANAELGLLAADVEAELAKAMPPFCPAPKGWKALFA